ncbi:MAG: leucine-rich repeat domain-containing protein [Candidatus Promineifilaceae bacterium]
MLQEAWKQFELDKDRTRFLDAVKQTYGITTIHSTVEAYIFDMVPAAGMFTLRPFQACFLGTPWTYNRLVYRFGDELFPGDWIGYDNAGIQFLLLLETGQVITLHHDATFYEVAGDIRARTPADFLKKFAKAGSVMTIDRLIALQQASVAFKHLDEDMPTYAAEWLRLVSKSLKLSMGHFNRNIHKERYEFIANRCRELIETSQMNTNQMNTLAMAEKKIAKLAAPLGKHVGLGHCFLRSIPIERLRDPILTSLDLSGNPLVIGDELTSLNLLKLGLRDCQLTYVPQLPQTLTHLNLQGNLLTNIDVLYSLTQLKELKLYATGLPTSIIRHLEAALPKTKVLADIIRDDLSAETLDLSNHELSNLPEELFVMPNLTTLDLTDNPILDWDTACEQLGRIKTLKTLIINQNMPRTYLDRGYKQFELPETCRFLTVEEIDFGKSKGWRTPLSRHGLRELLTRLSTIKTLKVMPELHIKTLDVFTLFVEMLPHFAHITTFQITYKLARDSALWSQMLTTLGTFPQLESVILPIAGRKDANEMPFNEIAHVKHLQLDGRGWNANELLPLTQLQSLKLDCVNGGLVDEISRLHDLRHLEFYDYLSLKVIAPAIAQLPKLETLILGKSLEQLFPILGEFAQLKTLDLSQCSLDDKQNTVPDQWCKLSQLEKLRLPKKGITQLPTALGDLSALRYLDLRNNLITQLPESIGRCERLERLELNATCLTHFPDSVGQLKALRQLTLRFTGSVNRQFNTLPDALLMLPNLNEVQLLIGESLSAETAFHLLSQLGQLPALERLTIHLPQPSAEIVYETAISQMKQLKHLTWLKLNHELHEVILATPFESLHTDFHLCEQMDVIERSVKTLAKHSTLRHFILDYWTDNYPDNAPSALSKFKQLDTLTILHRRLATAPRQILRLRNLKILRRDGLFGMWSKRTMEAALPHTRLQRCDASDYRETDNNRRW